MRRFILLLRLILSLCGICESLALTLRLSPLSFTPVHIVRSEVSARQTPHVGELWLE